MMAYQYYRGAACVEWWWIDDSFVRIEYDRAWFSREGSINDLKQIAMKEKQNGN